MSLLDEIRERLAGLGLRINEKKTHIVKLSHGFTFLQIKYNITRTGKILKRMSHGKIVRERRRLKAFKRMFDAGQMTEGKVWDCYQSWRGTIIREHNACHKTLLSMDSLYKSMFPAHEPYQRKGRKELCAETYNMIEIEDIHYIV